MTFHYVEISVFCLATEDEAKVRHALDFVTGEPKLSVEVLESMGFHKNPIKVLSVTLKKAQQVKGLFSRMAEAGLAGPLLAQLEERLDDELFLNIRLNKQEAFNERLVLASEDPAGGVISLRARVKAFPSKREPALEAVKEYLGGLV